MGGERGEGREEGVKMREREEVNERGREGGGERCRGEELTKLIVKVSL